MRARWTWLSEERPSKRAKTAGAGFAALYFFLGVVGFQGWDGNPHDPVLIVATYTWTGAIWILFRTFTTSTMSGQEAAVRFTGGVAVLLLGLFTDWVIVVAALPPVIELVALTVAKRQKRPRPETRWFKSSSSPADH